MKCAVCGKTQFARCDGGWIDYISVIEPCSRTTGREPIIKATADPWTIEPEPSAAGLEDLL